MQNKQHCLIIDFNNLGYAVKHLTSSEIAELDSEYQAVRFSNGVFEECLASAKTTNKNDELLRLNLFWCPIGITEQERNDLLAEWLTLEKNSK
jgi:hypothetical protein